MIWQGGANLPPSGSIKTGLNNSVRFSFMDYGIRNQG